MNSENKFVIEAKRVTFNFGTVILFSNNILFFKKGIDAWITVGNRSRQLTLFNRHLFSERSIILQYEKQTRLINRND